MSKMRAELMHINKASRKAQREQQIGEPDPKGNFKHETTHGKGDGLKQRVRDTSLEIVLGAHPNKHDCKRKP
jgi:hypothetical protein